MFYRFWFWCGIRLDLQRNHLWINLESKSVQKKKNLTTSRFRTCFGTVLDRFRFCGVSHFCQNEVEINPPRKPFMSESLRRVPKKICQSASFEPAQSKRNRFWFCCRNHLADKIYLSVLGRGTTNKQKRPALQKFDMVCFTCVILLFDVYIICKFRAYF